MAAKKEYVVRVVVFNGPNAGYDDVTKLLESLRYAQVIDLHREDHESTCFDIICPHGLDSKTWSEMNANRMQSFGYNAVSAPSTR